MITSAIFIIIAVLEFNGLSLPTELKIATIALWLYSWIDVKVKVGNE